MHHFGERQVVLQRHLGGQVLHLLLRAALVVAQLQHRSDVIRAAPGYWPMMMGSRISSISFTGGSFAGLST